MPEFPGDDRRSAWGRAPEIIAAEQHVLTLADALLSWMMQMKMSDRDLERATLFFTHETDVNPGLRQFTDPVDGVTKRWLLDKLDPDANRFFAELLRAAWERRKWMVLTGERHPDACA